MPSGHSWLGPPPEPEVHRVLEAALLHAASSGHASVRVEHVALALCADPEVARVLEELGVRVEPIDLALEQALSSLANADLAPGVERTMDFGVQRVLDRAASAPGGVDRLGLLAALFEHGAIPGFVGDARATASLLRERLGRRVVAAAAQAPYRAAQRPAGFALAFVDSEPSSPALVARLARGAGLGRAAALRAQLRAREPGGVVVGLFGEADARHLAEAAQASARDAGAGLTVEARALPRRTLLERPVVPVRRWWRAVMVLRIAAALAVLVGAAQAYRASVPRYVAVSSAATLRDDDVRYARIHAPAEANHPRWLLPEGLPFDGDPLHPTEISILYSVEERQHIGHRVVVRRPWKDTPVCSWEAERVIQSATTTRRVMSRFRFYTSGNRSYHALVIGSADVNGSFEGTVRAPAETGAVEDITTRCPAVAGTTFGVVDVDPLPPGRSTMWVPICTDVHLVDYNCKPVLWGVVDDRGLAAWNPKVGMTLLEGWLGTLEEQRLPGAHLLGPTRVRTLQLAPPPGIMVSDFARIGGALLVGALFGLAARRVRLRHRPAD